MRAARLVEPRRIELVDLPDPVPGSGEAVVRVAAVGLCASDLAAYQGRHPRLQPPLVLGHELAGSVVAIGPEVEHLKLGTRVCVEPNVCCGRCRYCLRGQPNLCPEARLIGEHPALGGGCAELVAVPAEQLYPLPERVSCAEAALVQPLATAYHAVLDRAELVEHELALILGAGPIGLGVMLAARSFGARTIVADVLDDRLALARDLGADLVVNSAEHDLAAVVRRESEGYGVHVTFEAVGGDQSGTLAQAVRLTARGGRVIALGGGAGPEVGLPLDELARGELDLRGVQGHPGTFRPTLDLIALGALPAGRLISHRLPLAEIDEAFALLESKGRGVLKIIVEP